MPGLQSASSESQLTYHPKDTLATINRKMPLPKKKKKGKAIKTKIFKLEKATLALDVQTSMKERSKTEKSKVNYNLKATN
jgi:hypothetical protein